MKKMQDGVPIRFLRSSVMDAGVESALRKMAQGARQITILTGAGVSAESGIPTFRGPEGYWTVGAREYHPQEMATYDMFSRNPHEVWKWYLHRMGVCRNAQPNPGHLALADMENMLQDRFTLITQNVDGLHLRAGNSLKRTYQIHGNIFSMRYAKECSDDVSPLPKTVEAKTGEEPLTQEDKKSLQCPRCKGPSRPHVLWFDESYNERHYHFYSSLQAAQKTDLLLIVGTSGSTNLPHQIAVCVSDGGGVLIDVNIEENPFSQLAQANGKGFFIQQSGASVLPVIRDIFARSLGGSEKNDVLREGVS